MLGFQTTKKPITGEFAKEFNESLHRFQSGNLNEEDKEVVQFFRSERKVKLQQDF